MRLVRLALPVVVGLSLVLAAGPAQATTLTFDELPYQSVDELSFMGVTFGFEVGGFPSSDAYYNSSAGPGSTIYVQAPSLEGSSVGILTLDFANPTPLLQFGVALSTVSTLSPGVTIELFDAGLTSLGVFNLNTIAISSSHTEGHFTYSGTEEVAQAVLDFEDSAGRFALDNLTYVPEPGTLLLLGAGLFGLGLRRVRRRH